jgi:predicted GH43/DUF377 family glycosyl hydrolase
LALILSGKKMMKKIAMRSIEKINFLQWVLLLLVSVNAQPFLFSSFYKPAQNPILSADPEPSFYCPVNKTSVSWRKADVFNPAAIVWNDSIYVLPRCEDNPAASLGDRTSRIGLAASADGIHFNWHSEPVLYPAEDAYKSYDFPGGCEDPRIAVTEDSTFVLLYTSWNQDVARLSVAFSRDLIHWTKKGPAFATAYNGKFLNFFSKSGSIVTRFVNDRQVIAKINGRYLMYWGERWVNVAWSDNLYDWYPTLNADSSLKTVISPRTKKFDSQLTECGPPALITRNGILLLYNGKNGTNSNADPSLPPGTYSVGQVLFDTVDVQKVIARSDTCILKPTLPHEMTGQYAAGTTFSEGLVLYKGKWFLYYGTADSYVGVALTMLPDPDSIYPAYKRTGEVGANMPVVASSSHDDAVKLNYVNDGDSATRWSSEYKDSQWVYIDLICPLSISRVELKWEAAFAAGYVIQTSLDAQNWTTVHTQTAGTGGSEEIEFSPITARYVRMFATSRALPQYGYSLWDMKVYAAPEITTTYPRRPKQLRKNFTDARGDVQVFDVRGRLITRHFDSQWDVKSGRIKSLPAGVYVVKTIQYDGTIKNILRSGAD